MNQKDKYNSLHVRTQKGVNRGNILLSARVRDALGVGRFVAASIDDKGRLHLTPVRVPLGTRCISRVMGGPTASRLAITAALAHSNYEPSRSYKAVVTPTDVVIELEDTGADTPVAG